MKLEMFLPSSLVHAVILAFNRMCPLESKLVFQARGQNKAVVDIGIPAKLCV